MSFGGQPLEFYDRDDEDEFHRGDPFVIAGCLIKPMSRERFRVEDKHGKHLGTFFDLNDAIEHANLKGDPADRDVEDARDSVEEGRYGVYYTKDVPF